MVTADRLSPSMLSQRQQLARRARRVDEGAQLALHCAGHRKVRSSLSDQGLSDGQLLEQMTDLVLKMVHPTGRDYDITSIMTKS